MTDEAVSGLTRSLAPKTVQGRASALRALLRFWFLDDVTGIDLSASVPKVAHRSSGLPKGPPAEQVTALLASCDRRSVNGLRDLAILTMLVRLGLRAGEIAALQLEDLDWSDTVSISRSAIAAVSPASTASFAGRRQRITAPNFACLRTRRPGVGR